MSAVSVWIVITVLRFVFYLNERENVIHAGKIGSSYEKLNLHEIYLTYRNSHPKVFCTEGVLNNFAKLAGKHLTGNLF